jgi:hypothetical protein
MIRKVEGVIGNIAHPRKLGFHAWAETNRF